MKTSQDACALCAAMSRGKTQQLSSRGGSSEIPAAAWSGSSVCRDVGGLELAVPKKRHRK